MKHVYTISRAAIVAAMSLTTAVAAVAGDGTETSPYTVAELLAQQDALAASGTTVWVKADLKGLGEDGALTENAAYKDGDGHTQYRMAALFGDDTGTFVAYSFNILSGLAMEDLTNTSGLLIALNYQAQGHPNGNTANPEYATDYEPQELHFSLAEVRGALALTINGGYRGYHIASSYIVPQDIVAIKVSAGYTSKTGLAYVNCDNAFDGAEATYVTPKNCGLVLLATEGTYDIVLTADLYDQKFSNGNALNCGTAAGVNVNTTKKRWHYRFVASADKLGFERNGSTDTEVVLQAKDEVYLSVSNDDNNFGGKYEFETDDKKWISWTGKSIADYHVTGIKSINSSQYGSLPSADVFYNLHGQRLTRPAKGLYIKNGKKHIQ